MLLRTQAIPLRRTPAKPTNQEITMSNKKKTDDSTKASSAHEAPTQAVSDAPESRGYLPISAISIDDEIKSLIPPLPKDEKDMLAESLRLHGQLSPVLIWRTEGKVILLDGHNRIELVAGLHENGQDDPPVEVKELAFETRAEALDFIIENQLSRRNLRPDAMALLRGKLHLTQKQDRRGNLKQNREPKGQNGLSETTAENIAKQAGVSAKTVQRDAEFAAAAEKLGVTADILAGTEKRSRKAIIAAANPKKKTGTAAEETREQRLEKGWLRMVDGIAAADMDEVRRWLIPAAKITLKDVRAFTACPEPAGEGGDSSSELPTEPVPETSTPGAEDVSSSQPAEPQASAPDHPAPLSREKFAKWNALFESLLRKAKNEVKVSKSDGAVLQEIKAWFSELQPVEPTEREAMAETEVAP